MRNDQKNEITTRGNVDHEILDKVENVELWRMYASSTAAETNTNDGVAVKALDVAADMLCQQWPRGGPVDVYRDKILHPMSTNYYSLPCSYLIVKRVSHDGVVVHHDQNTQDHDYPLVLGHGRLTECFEGGYGGTNAAAATYILVAPEHRSCGYGRLLMTLLEKEATRLGYHYLYLWTQQQVVPFYLKLGYMETERVSLHRACLKTLQVEQVSKLEQMLSQKLQVRAGSCCLSRSETVLLPPSDGMTQEDDDVWLRKRLIESVGSIDVPLQERVMEMEEAICAYLEQGSLEIPSDCQWQYRLVRMPWQKQVGPSCGLAALRMIRDYYHSSSDFKQMPSLLAHAQEKGYSQDGEIFDVDNLQKLAHEVCGLDCEMRAFSTTTVDDVCAVLDQNGVLILAYDSSPGTRLPGLLSGRSAHYGIIVGMLLAFPTSIDEESAPVRDTPVLQPHVDRPLSESCHVLLMVQHSLSCKLAIAPWKNWFDSNQQLVTIDRSRFRMATSLNLCDCLVIVKR